MVWLKLSKARLAVVCLVGLLVVPAAPGAPGGPVDGPGVDASCSAQELEVALVPGEPATHRVAGWLCARTLFAGQTVIIASHAAVADHTYWDWPEDPDAFSFVRAATEAGYAVFNYDRIGAGESDRPPAALVTLASGAYVLHQLAGDLRDGAFGGTSFGKVVLLGNSYGTLISIFAAELYPDFDAVVNTGVLVGPHPEGLADLFALFYPAQLDPKFADEGVPPGYMTSVPGGRDVMFHLPAAEPAVLALDEALKDLVTMPEAATFGLWTPATHLVEVPVLSVVGDRDFLFCRPQCEPDGVEVSKEPLFWGPQTCFELALLPETGHSVQLHRAAATSFHPLLLDWLDRHVGDGGTAPSAPCAA